MAESHSPPQGDGVNTPQERQAGNRNYRGVLPDNDLAVESQQGPFLIHKGQPISFHPLAEKVPRDEKHRTRLRASLETKGQMEPIKVLLVDGHPQVVDGVTRTEELFALDQPVFASVLTDSERHGLSVAAWIVAKNLSASEGRQLNDTQRALLAAGASKDIENAAEKRKISGKAVHDDQRGSTQDFLAKLANVSGNRIRDARLVAPCDDLRNAAWNGEVPLSTAAKIAGITSQRDRKRALNAAKERDHDLVREIIESVMSSEAPSKQDTSSNATATMPGTRAWPKQISHLRHVIEWIENTANKPEGRVLAATVSIQSLREMIERIERSRPHAPCPCCRHFPDKKCGYCAGSGWLTQEEYDRYEAELTATFIHHIKSRDNGDN